MCGHRLQFVPSDSNLFPQIRICGHRFEIFLDVPLKAPHCYNILLKNNLVLLKYFAKLNWQFLKHAKGATNTNFAPFRIMSSTLRHLAAPCSTLSDHMRFIEISEN